MCIVRSSDLSSDDLAFLTSRSATCEPDEDALQRSLAIHESAGVDFSPVCSESDHRLLSLPFTPPFPKGVNPVCGDPSA